MMFEPTLLPDLPVGLASPPCVSFPEKNNKEILICGGCDKRCCYSYHIKRQEYRLICHYPRDVRLWGHTVVAYSSNSFNSCEKNASNTFILLSFGGRPQTWHTLMMKYQSVWNDDKEENDNNNNKSNSDGETNEKIKNKKSLTRLDNDSPYKNEWISLPNQLKFGEKTKDDLYGVRALIGGSNRHLLFITHPPRNVDVINLNSFEYLNDIKNNILPVDKYNLVWFHCFVPIRDMLRKKKNVDNEFVLMSHGDIFWMIYDEINKEFFYKHIVSFYSFEKLKHCAFACRDYGMFLFGADNKYDGETLDNIWQITIVHNNFHMEKHTWKFPSPICASTAIVSESDHSIHIIGGIYDRQDKKTHYILITLMEPEIDKIVQYWIHVKNLNSKWVYELNRIIYNYINGAPFRYKSLL